MSTRAFTFAGGEKGAFRVSRITAVAGEMLPNVPYISVAPGIVPIGEERPRWFLRGTTSNERYVTRTEKEKLAAHSPPLGRSQATMAALIPIRKTAGWWAMTQDERRAVFEERSRHMTIGMKYLPAIARRLQHCRDLGDTEPFDFLTLFDYAKADAHAFDDMMAELRATEEWKFVDREVDLRLERIDA